MRRRSLIGPLLLVLLGTLLLVRNFRPDFPFWEMVARWWPVVLVVWGLAKLAEALRPRPEGAPAWRPSLTVGEFFLALLVILVGVSASKWVEVRDRVPGGVWDDIGIFGPWNTAERTVNEELKHAFEPKSTLYVDNSRGDVRISGGEVTEMTVQVAKTARASTDEEAGRLAEQPKTEIVREGDGYTVRVTGTDTRVRADLDITVPRATPVRTELRRGSLTVGGVNGPVTATVERGDATVADVAGDVRVQLRRGSLTARNITGNVELEGRGSDINVTDVSGQLLVRGDYSGASDYARVAKGVKFTSSRTELEIQKLPGHLEMTIGSLTVVKPEGMVTVNARNKDIRIEEFSEKVSVVTRGATVELRTSKLPLRDIDVENHSGTIELALPDGAQFQVEATARRGDVDNEFTPLEVVREDDSGTIKGSVGQQASAQVKLHTSYGTIRLRKMGPGEEKAETAEPERQSRPSVTPPAPPAPEPPARPGRRTSSATRVCFPGVPSFATLRVQ